MFRWLRTGNPYTFFHLLLYSLVIKFYYLSHPAGPLVAPLSDGLLYEWIVRWLKEEAGFGPAGFTVTSFIVLFVEATVLNTQVNRFRVLPGVSFFVAFCFLLFSSFFISWNVFSAPLVAGLFMLLLVRQFFRLYDHPTGRTAAFNLGLIVGMAGLIYLPALVLLLLVWFALLVSRPFRLAEWILVVVGLLCPYYFVATFLFLTDQLSVFATFPLPGFSLPETHYSYWVVGGLTGLLAYFLYGGLRLQQIYPKMLIHTRKSWTILLAFLIIGLALPFIPNRFQIAGWLIAFVPMTVIIACGLWHVKKRWFGLLLHLVALAFVFFLQWVR